MLRIMICAALLCAPALASAEEKGEIDWVRRVIKARGQGAPDLSAPSISVARLGAERAAKADALRNLLETLKGASVESGKSVGTLLQDDSALRTKVQGALKGFRLAPSTAAAKNPKYFSDGGVAVDVELPIDSLPAELAKSIKAPEGVAQPAAVEAQEGAAAQPASEGEGASSPPGFIIDVSGQKSPGRAPRIVDEDGEEVFSPASVDIEKVEAAGLSSYAGFARSRDEAAKNPRLKGSTASVKAMRVTGSDVVVDRTAAASLRKATDALSTGRIVFVIP